MKATVAEKREVAKGTLLVLFAVDDYPDYRPGAYFWVELPDRGDDDEKGLRRHISLVTSPTETGVVGLATRLRDTAFKRTLAELEVGDEVEVEEPKGSFLLPEDTAPIRLRRRRDRDHRLPLDAPLHRRRAAAVPRHARLLEPRPRVGRVPGRARGARGPDRRSARRADDDRRRGWEGETRRLDADVLRELVGDLERQALPRRRPAARWPRQSPTRSPARAPGRQVLAGKFSGY